MNNKKIILKAVFTDKSRLDDYWEKLSDKTGLCCGYHSKSECSFFVHYAAQVMEYMYEDRSFTIYDYGPGVSKLTKETYNKLKGINNDFIYF